MKVGKQPKAKPAPPVGDLPWYAKVKPGESMEEAASKEQDRMNASRESRQVGNKFNFV